VDEVKMACLLAPITPATIKQIIQTLFRQMLQKALVKHLSYRNM